MFIIRLLGMVLAFPLVIILGAIISLIAAMDKIMGIVVGLLNAAIAIVILYSLIVTKDYEITKKAYLLVEA